MTEMNIVAAKLMEHLCDHAAHGYTQSARWGDGSIEKVLVDGVAYNLAGGDRDCSSAVISAYKAAGLDVNSTYTGNMRRGFLATGLFEWRPLNFSAQVGDIYLNETHHTAMCVSPYGSRRGDLLAEFSISENGSVYGNKGDQTGVESSVKPFYKYWAGWDGILHYVGNAAARSMPSAHSSNKAVDITYSLRQKGRGWLPAVKNYNTLNHSGYAGVQGMAHNGFKASVSRGSIKYRVHSANGRWTKWASDGEVCEGSPWIDGIQLYYETTAGEDYQQAWYRASTTKDNSYLDVCCDDGTVAAGFDGWAGLYGKPLDKLQVYIGSICKF